MPSHEERHEELIARYEKGSNLLAEALRDIPHAILDRSPAPGKWTIRQQAAHLADAELVSNARFRWVAAEPGVALPAWDQDKWAGVLDYPAQSPAEVIALTRLLRRSSAALLRSLPDDAWQRTGIHQERGPVTLLQLVELVSGHLEHHAQHIKKLRAQFGA